MYPFGFSIQNMNKILSSSKKEEEEEYKLEQLSFNKLE